MRRRFHRRNVSVSAKAYNCFPLLILSVIMVCSEGRGHARHHKKKEVGDKMKGIAVNEKRLKVFWVFLLLSVR